jgi:hypothetical protein
MTNVMKWSVWTSACCLALLISGCAKRQTGTRLVYVASPPAATTAAPQDSGMLVIEEPAGPQLTVLQPRKDLKFLNTPLPTPPSPRKATSVSSSPADSSPEGSLVEPPPLEPANNPGQGSRQQLEKTQHDMGSSIEQIQRRQLSDPERQTLAEAKAFLDQSKAALNEGDPQRAEKLADKARLLITALEKGH